jgi:CRISPR-associated endonuclease/helicase Cas3
MVMAISAAQSALWGKLGDGSNGFHPLICHGLDTAAVTRELFATALPSGLLDRIARGIGIDTVSAEAFVVLAAGLHDLGKASPDFQYRRLPDLYDHRDRLAAAGLVDPQPGMGKGHPHGVTGAVMLRDWFERQGVARSVAVQLGAIIGGHHGIPDHGPLHLGESTTGDTAWATAREDLSTLLLDTVGRPTVYPTRVDRVALLLLGGIVSVADWIASDESRFSYLSDVPFEPRAYVAARQVRARDVIATIGWLARPSTTSPEMTFEEAFAKQPRPLQREADRLGAEMAPPAIAIIEAPMGEGKTEAALRLADRWMRAGNARGIYFALPTQATSNQMLERVIAALERRYPGEQLGIQLLHGAKVVSATFQELIAAGAQIESDPATFPAAIEGPLEDEAAAGGVIASQWFTGRKRGLLAPFGVGTVDQALLAVLPVPHAFVRLLGIAGKVVIIDEVHAYDAYTFSLIERLVEYLAAVESSVVILSATLPNARRASLSAAFCRGLGVTDSPAASDVSYPRLTVADRSGERVEAIATDPAVCRAIGILWREDPHTSDTACDELLDAAAAGAQVGVIANTVRRAQGLYTRIAERGRERGVTIELDLFHARFLLRDRLTRERRVVERYGPTGTLDFDLLVTDLAPIDLLLQRSGRLWRHRVNDARRPAIVGAAPALRVIRPAAVPDGTVDHGASAYVYDGHLIDRTYLELRDRLAIDIPGEVSDRVEAVYAEGVLAPPELPEVWRERWARGAVAQRTEYEAQAGIAGLRRLPSPVALGGVRLTDDFRLSIDDPDGRSAAEAGATRLGAGGIPVLIAEEADYRSGDLQLGDCTLRLRGARLDRAATIAALESSLNVPLPTSLRAPKYVIRLRRMDPPTAFAATPALSRTRLLLRRPDGSLIDSEGQEIEGLRLDPALGLIITRPVR